MDKKPKKKRGPKKSIVLDGRLLKRARSESELTQAGLAEKAGVRVDTVTRAERDEPILETAARNLGAALNRPFEDLTRRPIINIPVRVPTYFIGRDNELGMIKKKLSGFKRDVDIVALSGLPGIGKTVLAAAFAESQRRRYRATWWIRAETEASMRADLFALARRLDWIGDDEKEETGITILMERLWEEGDRFLLIFDDAKNPDTLKPFLPRGGAKVLITSITTNVWGRIASQIEIESWPKKIGAEYLITRSGRKNGRVAAVSLSEALGGLPLAHEQAAAYCEQIDVSFAEYQKRFTIAPLKFLDDRRHAPAEYHNRRTVAKTFLLAIEEANKLNPIVEQLVHILALLAPEPIPVFLLSEAREELGEPLASALTGEGLDEALAALRTFALIRRDVIVDRLNTAVTSDVIYMHHLVREIASARCDNNVRAQLRQILARMLAAVYPRNVYSNKDLWPRCALVTPHLLAICDSRMPGAIGIVCADLLNRAGGYFHGLGAYSLAGPLLDQALQIRDEADPEGLDTAESLNNLGGLLHVQGDFDGAQPLLQRALAIREKAIPNDDETAQSLNNLAWLLKDKGDLSAAQHLLERALTIREQAGPESEEIAESSTA